VGPGWCRSPSGEIATPGLSPLGSVLRSDQNQHYCRPRRQDSDSVPTRRSRSPGSRAPPRSSRRRLGRRQAATPRIATVSWTGSRVPAVPRRSGRPRLTRGAASQRSAARPAGCRHRSRAARADVATRGRHHRGAWPGAGGVRAEYERSVGELCAGSCGTRLAPVPLPREGIDGDRVDCDAPPVPRLGVSLDHIGVGAPHHSPSDDDGAGEEVDVAPPQRTQLAPPRARHRSHAQECCKVRICSLDLTRSAVHRAIREGQPLPIRMLR
jgi:hypothetical protein